MSSWSTSRIKDLFNTYTGATPSSKVPSNWDGDIVWITPADMSDFGEIQQGETNITLTGYNSCSTNLVPQGSIILSSRAPIGKVNIAATPLCTNQGCKSLVPKNVNSKFVAYYLYNSSKDLDILGQGTTFKELPLKRIVAFPVFLPDRITQDRIVSYLDEKTKSILERIEILEKKKSAFSRLKASLILSTVTKGLNKESELKDSGIDWIGNVPSHWNLIRYKNLIKLFKGKTPKDFSFEPNGLPYLTMDYLRDRKGKSTMYPDEIEDLIAIDANQILVLWDGANAGEFIKSKNGYLGSTMAVLQTKAFNVDYLYYFLKSIESTSKHFAAGTTIPHFDSDILLNYNYPVPPMSEQETIANYLNNQCSMIDMNIDNIEKQIESYIRLKKALINEVITGKRAV